MKTEPSLVHNFSNNLKYSVWSMNQWFLEPIKIMWVEATFYILFDFFFKERIKIESSNFLNKPEKRREGVPWERWKITECNTISCKCGHRHMIQNIVIQICSYIVQLFRRTKREHVKAEYLSWVIQPLQKSQDSHLGVIVN